MADGRRACAVGWSTSISNAYGISMWCTYMKKALLEPLCCMVMREQGIRPLAANVALNHITCTFQCDRDHTNAPTDVWGGTEEDSKEEADSQGSRQPMHAVRGLWVGLDSLAKCMVYPCSIRT